MDPSPVSQRSTRIRSVTPYPLLDAYYSHSEYTRRRDEPEIIDFAFGNPHEMPRPAYVATLREVLTPHDKDWFADT